MASGGKFDYTIKWWSHERYQQVVDHFEGRIEFVQVGEAGHHHPPLRRRHRPARPDDLRQLVRLMYHAQGVICAVSFLMHLAAAVEVKPGMPQNRPCVVVAGGREPPHWTAYPASPVHPHASARCAAATTAGAGSRARCRSATATRRTSPSSSASTPVGDLPRCMDMITARDVIGRIELYFDGGLLPARARRAMDTVLADRLALEITGR